MEKSAYVDKIGKLSWIVICEWSQWLECPEWSRL